MDSGARALAFWPYCRKSRALDDLSDPNVLLHQEAALLRLAGERDWPIDKGDIIREIGSGETIESRPRFRAWLKMAESLPEDHGGTILVTALDRLSRGTMRERGWIADVLIRADIKIATPGGIYDLRNPDHLMLFGVISSVAHYSLGRYKQDMQLRFQVLREQGRSISLNPPFGYRRPASPNRRETLTWEPHPDRWPLLLAWVEEIEHLTTRQLAERYGVKQYLVWDTLTNPAIAGYPHKRYRSARGLRQWHTKDGSAPLVRLPREQWIPPQQRGDYPPACSWERWLQIQQILESRRNQKSGRGDNANGWARDVVLFEGHLHLRAHLSRLPYPPGDDRHLTYEAKPPGRPALYIPRAWVHRHLERVLARIFADPAGVAADLQNYQRDRQDEQDRTREQTELQRIQAQIEEHREQMVLLELRSGRGDSEDQLANERARDRLKEAIRNLQGAVTALSRPPVLNPALEAMMEKVASNLDNLPDWWTGLTGDDRRQVVDAFILALVVRITPQPGRREWRREISETRLQPWLKSFGE